MYQQKMQANYYLGLHIYPQGKSIYSLQRVCFHQELFLHHYLNYLFYDNVLHIPYLFQNDGNNNNHSVDRVLFGHPSLSFRSSHYIGCLADFRYGIDLS